MTDTLTKILLILFGLYSGVLSWLFKLAWSDIQNLKASQAKISPEDIKILKIEQDKLKENCTKCQSATLESIRELIDERFDQFERRLDTKIDSAFQRNELNWVNEGRIPPKHPKKST